MRRNSGPRAPTAFKIISDQVAQSAQPQGPGVARATFSPGAARSDGSARESGCGLELSRRSPPIRGVRPRRTERDDRLSQGLRCRWRFGSGRSEIQRFLAAKAPSCRGTSTNFQRRAVSFTRVHPKPCALRRPCCCFCAPPAAPRSSSCRPGPSFMPSPLARMRAARSRPRRSLDDPCSPLSASSSTSAS